MSKSKNTEKSNSKTENKLSESINFKRVKRHKFARRSYCRRCLIPISQHAFFCSTKCANIAIQTQIPIPSTK